MKRFGFWRSISVLAAATLLFTALVTPVVSHADDDFTNAPDIDAGVTTNVPDNALVDENNGTVSENLGAINVNNCSIDENSGRVYTNNGDIVNNTEMGEVITNSETGEIETNYGAIDTNEGTVQTNAEGDSSIGTNIGTVEENNGSITTNGENGSIPTNDDYTGIVDENNSYIGQNLETGLVTVNEGIIESNEGTVVTNRAPENPDDPSLGTVYGNSGVVQENHGTVINEVTGVVEVNHQDGTVNGGGTVNMNLGTGTVADGVTVQKQMWSVGTQNWNQFVTNATSENSYSVRSGNKTELWFDSDATLFIRSGNGICLADITVDRAYRNKVNIVKSQDGELLIWQISQLSGNVKLKLVVMSDAEEAGENTDPAQSDEPENAGNGTDTPDKTISESFFYKKGVTDVLTDSDKDKIHSVIEDIIKKDRNVEYINLYFIDNLNELSLDVFSTMSNFYGRSFILHFYINGKPYILSISSDECKMYCTLALSKAGEDGKGDKYIKNGSVGPVGKAGASGPVGKAGASDLVGKPDSSGDTEWDKQSAIITNIGMLFQHLETDEINFDDLRVFLFNESNGLNQPETGTAGVNDPTGETAVAGASGEAANGIKNESSEVYNKVIAAGIVRKIIARCENVSDKHNTTVIVKCGEIPQFSMDIITALFTNDMYNKEIHFEMNGKRYVLYIPGWTAKSALNDKNALRDILEYNDEPIIFAADLGYCGIRLVNEE